LDEQLNEVNLLKQMNNEGIVKYVNSWIEIDMNEIKTPRSHSSGAEDEFLSEKLFDISLVDDEEVDGLSFVKRKINNKTTKTTNETILINGANYK
jgi:hypothetical protein